MKALSVFMLLSALISLIGSEAQGAAANEPSNPTEFNGGGLFSVAAAPANPHEMDDPTTVRKRYVGVRFDLLGDRASPANSVELNLFEDAVFTAVFSRTESNSLGSYAWIGNLKGVEHGQAVLVVTNGVLAGKVSMPGAIYEVRSVGDGSHVIEEIDQSAFPPEMHGIPTPASETPAKASPGVAADGCDEITVLVPYTPEARIAAGGTAQIEAVVALAVTEANQSYVNSGAMQRLTLVHTMETTPGDAANSFSIDLGRLQNTADGKFDNVDAARETYFADEVGLVIENLSSCGLGYLNSSAAYAFSVTHRTCATGYYSFAHELGHNMSARHDWYVDDTLNSPWSYSKGFVNPPDRWRTIMAYNRRCFDFGYNCTRLQYWSNPNVIYGGDPMGVSTGGPTNCNENSTTPDPSTCAADNRTTLNNTCSTVANFRVSPSPCGLPAPTNDAQLRDQAAIWLGKCVHGSGYTPPGAAGVYTDVDPLDFGADWIEQCSTDGITSGCNIANTRYCSKDPVTKAQAVKLILLAEHGGGYSPPVAGAAPYGDVLTHPDVNWIAQAKTEGITTGCDATRFCPEEVLTQRGFQKMLDGAF